MALALQKCSDTFKRYRRDEHDLYRGRWERYNVRIPILGNCVMNPNT